MKKVYLLASFLGMTAFAFNQSSIQVKRANNPLKISKAVSHAKTQHMNPKAAGDSIWGDDFSNAANWTTGEAPGTEGNWVIGTFTDLPATVQAGNYYFPMHTDTNPFAFFDGLHFLLAENGSGNSVISQDAWIQNANSIDLSAYTTVTLQFDQEYRSFNHDSTFVEVSLDGGTTWEQRVDPNASVGSNNFTNENVVLLNFNVANSSTVKFRFHWYSPLNTGDDPNGGSGYAWEIDNIKVFQTYDNDLKTSGLYYSDTAGYTYHRIPLVQNSPMVAYVVAKNQGATAQTNVMFNASETSASYTASSAPITVNLATVDTLAIDVANGFTAPGAGTYSIDYNISADQTDDYPVNNQIRSYKFSVGGNLYAVDSSTIAMNGTPPQGSGVGYTSPMDYLSNDNFELTVPYKIHQAATLYGIDFQFGDADSTRHTLNAGILIIGRLMKYDPNATAQTDLFVEVAETQQYAVQAGDEWTYHSLQFDTPQNLDPNSLYAVTIKSFDPHYSIATSGHIKDAQIFEKSPGNGGNYYYWGEGTIGAPVIRMNFDPTLGTTNNEMTSLKVSQYPNPVNDITTISYNLDNAKTVSYSVVDLAGNVILTGNEGSQLKGNHSFTINASSFANGIYFLKLQAGNSVVTKKMVVNK